MQDQDSTLYIYLARDVPAEDRDRLLIALAAPDVGAKVSVPGRGPGEFVAVVQLVSEALGAVASGLVIADKVIEWRKDMRRRGQPTNVRIERPGREVADLNVATDDEIKHILSEDHPAK